MIRNASTQYLLLTPDSHSHLPVYASTPLLAMQGLQSPHRNLKRVKKLVCGNFEPMKILNSAPPLFLAVKVAAFPLIGPNRLKPFVTKTCRPTSSFIPLHMSIVTEEQMHQGTSSAFTVIDASSEKSNIYDELGFKEEQIALGINPEEVLQWLGTREDIITQLIEDNSNKIDRAKAELEVDKLLLDYEVVSKFIAYKKWAAENPETATKVAEIAAKEGKINFQEISLYALWIAAGVGISYVSKIVRGFWDASHPQLPNMDG